MLRMAVRRHCTMLVNNEHLEAACLARGIAPGRIIRWSYGVERRPEPSNGYHRRPVDFCFLGRLLSQKGIVDLVDAWRLLATRFPDNRLTIVGGGTGQFAEWCQREFAALGASVEYRGPLEGEAKWSVLQETRVLLFPSTYESFGLVALEAMAAGAVVVGYDSDVSRRAFGEGMVQVPSGDVRALADAAAGCFADRTRWQRQHQRSLATAARYDWEASSDQLAQRVLEECRVAPGVR
jgi:glycosyltransferase involved in cell wall biosynthesis